MAATSPKKSPVDEKSYILGQSQSPVDQQGTPGTPGSADDTRSLVPPESQSKEKTNLSMASFNYINSIIGSGVIGMPYAFYQAGFGLGLILLLLMAVVTDYSLVLMVRGAHLAAGRAGLLGADGGFSYPGLVFAAFGQAGYLFLAALQFIYPFIGQFPWFFDSWYWDFPYFCLSSFLHVHIVCYFLIPMKTMDILKIHHHLLQVWL